jgi:heme A synthase
MLNRSVLALVLALGALAASAASALACDTWKPVSGTWGTAADWSSGTVPTSAVEACITEPGT